MSHMGNLKLNQPTNLIFSSAGDVAPSTMSPLKLYQFYFVCRINLIQF